MTYTEVVTLGESMGLMKADAPGPLPHGSSLSLGMGGSESNVAIALSRLGTSVAWAGRVGDDSLGDLVLRELAAEGVVVEALRDSSAQTGFMIKERRTMDHLKIWYYRADSAGSRFSREDVPAERIAKARLLHLTGITPALSSSCAEAAHYAIDIAREAGVMVSFDVNYRTSLWTSSEAGEAFRKFIARADIVFAGDDEAAIVVGASPDSLELARRLAALGPGQAVIKRGPNGCAALIAGEEFAQEAIPINVVDTVGAGDAFVAGYIAELLRGAPVKERLLTAVRTGAFACLVPGDWEGMPRRHELALLDATEPVAR